MKRQGAIVKENSLRSMAKAFAFAAFVAAAAGGSAYAADLPMKAPPPPKPVPFFFVNDTSVSFTYFFDYLDPGVSGSSNTVPGGIAGQSNAFGMAQGSLDHFDLWEYGATLIHTEVNQYSDHAPIGGLAGAAGEREFFGFAQETLSLDALTHSKAFTTPITNDVGLLMRVTAGTDNHALAEETTQYAVGPNFDFVLPKILGGSMQWAITAYKEFTHSSFDSCAACGPGGTPIGGNRDFEWTYKIFEFNVLPLGPLLGSWADPAHIVNIASLTGPKGTGISTADCLALGCFGAAGTFNNNETKAELFEDVRLSVDTSKIFWGKPGIWDTYVGYRYWENMYGTNHNAALFSTIAPGTSVMSTAYLGTTYHFK